MTDNKIAQLLIRGILETGEYTLEGIALYTRIPYDVILDAACGNTALLSVTPWARIVDLYVQVKPDFAREIFEKLSTLLHHDERLLTNLLNDK